MEWGVERAVHEALRFLDDNQIHIHDSEKRPYFGLSAAIKELERTTQQAEREYGTLKLLQQFLQKRDWRRYEDERKSIETSIAYVQAGKGEEQDMQKIRDIVLSVEQESTQRRLDKIIGQYNLEPISVNGREILLCETLLFYKEMIAGEKEVIQEYHECVQEEEVTHVNPLESILLDSQENKKRVKDELFDDKVYVEQISEQYLDAIFAHTMLTAIAHEETTIQGSTDIDLEKVRNTYLIAVYRQAGLESPALEYSLRLQIKLDPSLGFWLDEQQNELNKLLHKKLHEKKISEQTLEQLMDRKGVHILEEDREEIIPQKAYVQGVVTTIPQSTRTH